jgi:uncharacterized membrane protein YGL010W
MGKLLEDSLTFYASYHHNLLNKIIHILCVWPILWTAQVFFFYLNVPESLQSFFPKGVDANWSLLLSLGYALFYFFIEQPGIAGPIASALVMGGYYFTKDLYHQDPESLWKTALAIHVICWVAQIGAHKVFEKRSPALLDNILGAFVMAPLFVVLEVMFMLGYKPEVNKAVEVAAVKNIAEFRRSQKVKN